MIVGRKNTRNLNLPRGMRARHRPSGTFYYLDTGEKPRREIALGKDYVQAVQKWAELTQEKAPREAQITFKYVADIYLREVSPTKAPATRQSNLWEMAKLLDFFNNPPAPLDSIEPIHIRQYLDWRKDAKIRANREKALFSHIWNFAREKGYTGKANPCAGIKGYKELGRDIYIEDHILKLVYAHAEQPLKDALDIAYLTGQRPADVLKLTQSDIKDGELMLRQNKTGQPLRIAVVGAFKKVIERTRQRKVMGLALVNNMEGYPMTKYMLRGAFDRARDAAKLAAPALAEEIAKFQFRDLRAKAGTDKEESEGMTAAQQQLGHSTQQMTQHYVRHRRGKLVNPTK
jgi:integrase